MEGKKHSSSSSSSSSFTNELFGSEELSSSPTASSSGLFNSIFPPPPKAYGNDYISSEFSQKHDYCATKQDTKNKLEDKTSRKPNMDMGVFYDQNTSHPCHLSSSIYYGGQDVYPSPPATNNTPGHYSSNQYNKDGEDDGRASRGNWWQGSLYY